jgi:hypothetical protein
MLAWIGLSVVTLAANPGCMGGCYVKADAVRTDPQTDCLALYGGQSASDPTVCATPQLGGVNNCSDPLTLPGRSPTSDPVVIAAGAKIAYPIPDPSAQPAISVTHPGSHATDYAIVASLGAQSVTITIPVHDE